MGCNKCIKSNCFVFFNDMFPRAAPTDSAPNQTSGNNIGSVVCAAKSCIPQPVNASLLQLSKPTKFGLLICISRKEQFFHSRMPIFCMEVDLMLAYD